MIQPGPSHAQLRAILEAATRTPDHGKLAPWRFVVVGSDQRDRLAQVVISAYRSERPEAGRLEIESLDTFARQAPTLVVALSAPDPASKIPAWEQELSAGAAIMNLILAAHAQGFVAAWLTGWAAYNETVRDTFGTGHERIAGFVFVGTASAPLEERPRPDYAAVVQDWNPPEG